MFIIYGQNCYRDLLFKSSEAGSIVEWIYKNKNYILRECYFLSVYYTKNDGEEVFIDCGNNYKEYDIGKMYEIVSRNL